MREGYIIGHALSRYSSRLNANDREFLARVWSTDPDIYSQRVQALGFEGLDRVLDAGCGMGQWAHALAKHNKRVDGIDTSLTRARIAAELNHRLGTRNASFSVQTVEKLAFDNGVFDGIYCYSVIYATDYRVTLKEFRRVLKPGGRLYICGNGVGWYLQNLLLGSRNYRAYDARRGAMAAILNTLTRITKGSHRRGEETIVSGPMMEKALRRLGFGSITRGGEGTIVTRAGAPSNPFFRARWLGLEGVYEVLAVRNAEA